MSPLFLEPVFQERIWGGDNLQKFGYDIPSNNTGECWGISAHENGPNIILNGEHKGKTLKQIWEENNDLFGEKKTEKFPLLTKILDANDELSVQVHPNDAYANKHENGELGKTECWYIIDCEEDAEIIYGHNAKDKEELREMIENGKWDALFNKIKVKPGDFFYVPSGTVHAIGKGIQILETQQNSDTTYRIYDYNRKDKNGNTRELHIDKSIDVINYVSKNEKTHPSTKKVGETEINTYISNEFFTVRKILIEDNYQYEKVNDFVLMSVINGEGKININNDTFKIKKGDHFVLTKGDSNIDFTGKLEMIESYI
ncbi:mannose-6-phosphate isomerase, class I [Macrococcus sp. EM39E]|uniref:mannose-6-phosphate isomerase, class I n=1 Tax=Macrococcus animalis TaxID=3395467 RepID=UPI0039BE1FF3